MADPHPDSPLASAARRLLTAAAAFLALTTPLTHLAQQLGLSFGNYALAVGVIAVAVLTACGAVWVRRPVRGLDRRTAAQLIGVCALAAALPVLVQLATADDAVYLPSVVHSLAHPADAMSFEVRYAWFGEPLVQSAHWNVATPYDYAQGALAHLTGIPLLTVRYLLGPALIGALGPLALFYLVTRFGFGDETALAGCVVAGALLLLMRETEHAPGGVALLRLCQGKFVVHAIGMTLFTALTIDLAREPSRATSYGPWGRLVATATAIAGCGSSSVLLLGLLAPLLAVAAACSFARGPRAALRTAGLLAASMAYPAFVAAWVLVSKSDSLRSAASIHDLYGRTFGANAAWVFPGAATWIGMLAASVLGFVGLSREGVRFIATWAIAAALLLLNPIVAPLVIEHVTTPNIYWRAFYVAPLLPLVALASAGVCRRLRSPRPGRAARNIDARKVGALVATLLLLQIPAHLGGLYSHSQLVRPFPNPDRCLNRIVAGQARHVAEHAPDGPMLAPLYLSRIIPLVSAGHPQLAHQEASLRHWAVDEATQRLLAARYLAGIGGDLDDVREVLRLHPEVVAVVAFPAGLSSGDLLEVLTQAQFVRSVPDGEGVAVFARAE